MENIPLASRAIVLLHSRHALPLLKNHFFNLPLFSVRISFRRRVSSVLAHVLMKKTGVLTGATKAQNAKIAGKFDGHLRLSEGLNVTSSGEAKGVS